MTRVIVYLGNHSAGLIDARRLAKYFDCTYINDFSGLLKILGTRRPAEVIFAHSSLLNFICFLLLPFSNFRLVVHNPLNFESRKGLRGVYDELLFRVQLLVIRKRIFLSEETKISFVPKEGDYLISNFVSPIASHRPISPDSRILFFGRYLSYKNVDLVYQLAKSSSLNFTIASSGCPYSSTNNCKVLNCYISDRQVEELYTTHDIIMLPYTKVSQSGPFYLGLEYGLTILCSDLPFFRQYEKYQNVILHRNNVESYERSLQELFSFKT